MIPRNASYAAKLIPVIGIRVFWSASETKSTHRRTARHPSLSPRSPDITRARRLLLV